MTIQRSRSTAIPCSFGRSRPSAAGRGHGPAGGVGGADPDLLKVAAPDDPTRRAGEQQTFGTLAVEGRLDDLAEVVGEALGEDGGAGLAVLGGLQGGGPAGGLLHGPADVHDPGGFEADVVGLEGDEFTPAEAGGVGESHGGRPPPMPEIFHGFEQGVAFLVGGQGGVGDIDGGGALDGGGLGVADHPHRVFALGGQPPQPNEHG